MNSELKVICFYLFFNFLKCSFNPLCYFIENNFFIAAKHHTSKLSDFEDLDKVDTFGFRGEALSSLCAAAKLTIITRHKDAKLATRLEFDSNGVIIKKKLEPRSIGTTAIVEDIFNVQPV